jgi:multiubiquitin
MSTETHVTVYHFLVNRTQLTTTKPALTGAEIKALAGVDPTDLLELREGDRKVPIQDSQLVEMKQGMKFVTYPGGRDS